MICDAAEVERYADLVMESGQCWLLLHAESGCDLLWLLSHSRRSHREWLAHVHKNTHAFPANLKIALMLLQTDNSRRISATALIMIRASGNDHLRLLIKSCNMILKLIKKVLSSVFIVPSNVNILNAHFPKVSNISINETAVFGVFEKSGKNKWKSMKLC